ncbi:MAG: elongation factor P maturation arginine rhamnosyltransferase EarP [Zetaproteobacteria bacterium CG_4_9_14_3_um_filter_53_7]|nr:MAG: elongation factor P maturation arginine rhamnosyltransferase EarP [Zetaproteobacteria bacterium CG_4_9_14_3_um_filter_53_7]
MPLEPITTVPDQSWDIFCNVVDNYGDIGVCWRLARQLAGEYGIAVRLWVDDLHSLTRLHPATDPTLAVQHRLGVKIRHWSDPFPEVEPATVIIDGFGCELPSSYLNAMSLRRPKPVWINLEYLSAETWVTGCHGLPSPRPDLDMVRHFFFPGFVRETGGLLRESELFARRDAFRSDVAAQARFWADLGMEAPHAEALKISLFCYENDNISPLLDCWANGQHRIVCLVPEGRVLPQVAAWLNEPSIAAGDIFRRGNLELRLLPFVAQERYDELLWLCDVNFVRGEDSLVRAGWAAKPMIWQIYPQNEMAHWPKLEAFLKLYSAALKPAEQVAVRRFWEAWNKGYGAAAAWPEFAGALQKLETHAGNWGKHLCHDAGGSLTANLLAFIQQIKENSPP